LVAPQIKTFVSFFQSVIKFVVGTVVGQFGKQNNGASSHVDTISQVEYVAEVQ